MLNVRKAADRGHADHGWLTSHHTFSFDTRGTAPGYDRKTFPDSQKRGRLRLVASPDGRDGSLTINMDAYVYAGHFDAGQKGERALGGERHAWVHVRSRMTPTFRYVGWVLRSRPGERNNRGDDRTISR